MQEQTLDQLWKSLDKRARTDLLATVADQLFIGPDAFTAWRRCYRPIPKDKRPRLEAIVERKFNIRLKTA